MKYTQEQFDDLPIVDDMRQCPTGDYSSIGSFGRGCGFGGGCSFGGGCRFGIGCRFGEYCRFGENCRFGIGCSFEHMGKGSEILQVRCGSSMRTSTAFNLDTGIYVRSGCFLGTLEEFKSKVIETHGDNRHAKAYMLWAQIIETYWLSA